MVRTYRAKAGAPVVPFPHAYSLPEWSHFSEEEVDPIGEEVGFLAKYEAYDKGQPPLWNPSGHVCGRPEAWVDGFLTGTDSPLVWLPQGLSTCCLGNRHLPVDAEPQLPFVLDVKARVRRGRRAAGRAAMRLLLSSHVQTITAVNADLPATFAISAQVGIGPHAEGSLSIALTITGVLAMQIQKDTVTVNAVNKLNFLTGTNTTLTAVDDPGNGSVDVTIDVTSIPTSILVGTFPYGRVTGAPSIPTDHNPTASVGLTAVNGTATTYMRSDGAPAISQGIAPTWTGLHTFTAGVNLGGTGGGALAATWTGNHIWTGTGTQITISPTSGAGVLFIAGAVAAANLRDTGASTDVKQFQMRSQSAHWTLKLINDAQSSILLGDIINCSAWTGYVAINGVAVDSNTDAQLHVYAAVATSAVAAFTAAASQTANMAEYKKSDGTVYGTVSENGYFTTRKTSAPSSGELIASEAAWWFNATNGAASVNFKAKQADGTVETCTLPVDCGDATKYRDGTGAWSTPPGTGGGTAYTTGAVAALGSTQGDAAALAYSAQVISGQDGTKGVRLPVTPVGPVVVDATGSGSTLKVYPGSGGSINSLASNAPHGISLTAVVYWPVSATQWRSSTIM